MLENQNIRKRKRPVYHHRRILYWVDIFKICPDWMIC